MTKRPPPEAGESLDQLTQDWWVYQLKREHRFSTDDVVTAWTAGTARPDARALVDIGAGIGSVGHMTLHFMGPEAKSIFVDARGQSSPLPEEHLSEWSRRPC